MTEQAVSSPESAVLPAAAEQEDQSLMETAPVEAPAPAEAPAEAEAAPEPQPEVPAEPAEESAAAPAARRRRSKGSGLSLEELMALEEAAARAKRIKTFNIIYVIIVLALAFLAGMQLERWLNG